MSRTTRRRLPWIAVALAALTACGSTVGSGAASGGAGLGLGASDGLGAPGAPTADGLSGGGSSIATDGAVGDPPGGGSAGLGTTFGSGSGSGGVGPAMQGGGAAAPRAAAPRADGGAVQGVTADKVVIGVETAEGADEYSSRYGLKGNTQGSAKSRADALVKHVNKLGGAGGRRIEVVYHDYAPGATTESQANQAAQAACEDFKSKKVFAVIAGGNGHSETYIACLQKAGILLISEASSNIDDVVLQRYPNVLAPDGFSLDRKTPALIAALADQGYFAPWDVRLAAPSRTGTTKIGLLSFDRPLYQRNAKRIEAELAKHGQKVSERFDINATSLDAGVAAVQSAVLRFAERGVDHVLFNTEAGAAFLLFAQNASAQAYYPRYGVGSFDFPQGVRDNNPDDKVFQGLLGIGWLYSGADVREHPPLGPRREACLKIFEAAGDTAASTNEKSIMLLDCEQWFVFAAAARAAGKDLTPDTLLAGAARITDRFSYETFQLDLTRSRAGVAAVGYLRYQEACKCVNYTKYPVPA